MADKSSIEWTDATWNPIRGCSRVSEGCRHCYAEGIAARFSGPGLPYDGLAKRVTLPAGGSEARWTGKIAYADDNVLRMPLRWREPRRIFVNSMSDLFHENVPDEIIDRVFAVMALCPQHTFQILTKRPERMRTYITDKATPDRIDRVMNDIAPAHWHRRELDDFGGWPLLGVSLGVSLEDQVTADVRIPYLLSTPAVVRFLSCEPLLGRMDIRWALSRNRLRIASGFHERGHFAPGLETIRPLDWVIVGGESGRGARPMHPDWARSLRDQCAAAGVPFFFKQWGEWADAGKVTFAKGPSFHQFEDGTWVQRYGKKVNGRELDGRTHDEFPS